MDWPSPIKKTDARGPAGAHFMPSTCHQTSYPDPKPSTSGNFNHGIVNDRGI